MYRKQPIFEVAYRERDMLGFGAVFDEGSDPKVS